MPDYSHIVIACSYLHVPGGYEKAVITTASLFARKGHKVTLLILDDHAELYYPVDPRVTVIQRPLHFGIGGKGNAFTRKIRMLADIRRLRKLVTSLKPTQLLCTEYPFAVAAVLAGLKKITRIYSWEHHHFTAQRMNAFWKYFFRRTYRKLDAVVCLNGDEQKFYLRLNKNAIVIPNWIEAAAGTGHSKEYEILSVTRFNEIKGIDLLMEVAKLILPSRPHWKWKVIGYGEQKDLFLDFIKKQNFADQLVYQPALSPDIAAEYGKAKIFVLTSRNECFPLVLLEAMENGLPCIAFDCETGPRHIIQDGQTGLLISREQTGKMAESICALLDDPDRIEKMGTEAKSAVRRFHAERIYPLWERLFLG